MGLKSPERCPCPCLLLFTILKNYSPAPAHLSSYLKIQERGKKGGGGGGGTLNFGLLVDGSRMYVLFFVDALKLEDEIAEMEDNASKMMGSTQGSRKSTYVYILHTLCHINEHIDGKSTKDKATTPIEAERDARCQTTHKWIEACLCSLPGQMVFLMEFFHFRDGGMLNEIKKRHDVQSRHSANSPGDRVIYPK
ncbi:hypothetical protein KQX54_020635 [Cotesia glomerata]|uniref:Uncharacterized protein n=1 Tax=Cotesia glomerata TaxID=32391 RepID=A0AAV7I4Y0_COTGL|nr:hypothetical protein KQX54_020635 [Cotesia glomerata]